MTDSDPRAVPTFIVLWRDESGALLSLALEGASTFVGEYERVQPYSDEILADPDAMVTDRRYAVSTDDARDFFGLTVE